MAFICPLQLQNKSTSMFQAPLWSSLSRLWVTMLPTSSGRPMGKVASKNGPSARLWPPRQTADLWRSLWRPSSFPFSSRKLRRARILLQVLWQSQISHPRGSPLGWEETHRTAANFISGFGRKLPETWENASLADVLWKSVFISQQEWAPLSVLF